MPTLPSIIVLSRYINGVLDKRFSLLSYISTPHYLLTSLYSSVKPKILLIFLYLLYLKSLHLFSLMSSPRSPLDLNLSLPNPVTGGTSAFRPFVFCTPTPIIASDYVMKNPITALRAASHLLTPRDHEVLARRPDYVSADESLSLIIQAATSVTNLRHRLLARGVEVESLCGHITTLRQQLQESTTKVERLKEERRDLKRENSFFSRRNIQECVRC